MENWLVQLSKKGENPPVTLLSTARECLTFGVGWDGMGLKKKKKYKLIFLEIDTSLRSQCFHVSFVLRKKINQWQINTCLAKVICFSKIWYTPKVKHTFGQLDRLYIWIFLTLTRFQNMVQSKCLHCNLVFLRSVSYLPFALRVLWIYLIWYFSDWKSNFLSKCKKKHFTESSGMEGT